LEEEKNESKTNMKISKKCPKEVKSQVTCAHQQKTTFSSLAMALHTRTNSHVIF
jgi:hypothetical protein